MDVKACRKINGKWRTHPANSCKIDDKNKINSLIKGAKHIGTDVIPGGSGLKTKTFNAYKKGKDYIVTNHYGIKLINAFVYPNKYELDRNFPYSTWETYTLRLLPR